ncbi:hypothetical protein [Nitrospira sp. Nam80]
MPLNKDAISALTEIESDPIQRKGRVSKRRDGQAWVRFEPRVKTHWSGRLTLIFNSHDLWHTAASHTIMRGRPLKEIQEVLSHKSFTMTQSHAFADRRPIAGTLDVS